MASPFRYHIFICNPSEFSLNFPSFGAAALLDSFRREIAERELEDAVLVAFCDVPLQIEGMPAVIVTPPGKWYTQVSPEDVSRIVESHIISGKVLEVRGDPDGDIVKRKIFEVRRMAAEEQEEQRRAGVLPAVLESKILGFMQSRVILSAIELDIFGALREKSLGSADVAGLLGLDERAADILMNALASMGLLNKKDGNFSNTGTAATHLCGESSYDLRPALMHRVYQFENWANLSEVVRRGAPVEFVKMQDRQKQWTEAFIAAMHKNGSYRAKKYAQLIDFSGVKRMLDLGGGSGAYSIAFANAWPGLESVVFDIPNVTPITHKYVALAGLSDRITTQDGDMHHDDYGSGFNMVFISAICHMNSPDENIAMFRRSADALNRDGRIVVGDFILNEDKTSPLSGALFSVNMLVATEFGNSYSFGEYSEWLKAAGFEKITRIDKGDAPVGLIEAVRAS